MIIEIVVNMVRWLSVDGHIVDGHFVVFHLCRIAIRIDSYVTCRLHRILMTFPHINVTYVALL